MPMQTLSYDLCRKALLTVQEDSPLAIFQVQPDACFAVGIEPERKKYIVQYCRYKDGFFTASFSEYVNTPSDVLNFCKEYTTNQTNADRSGIKTENESI